MSVGVRGLRLGTGPRGHYVHMGRGGLYYRASLNPRQQRNREVLPSNSGPSSPTPMHVVESGDVQQMVASSSSGLLDQINDRATSLRSWPLVFGLSLIGSLWAGSQPEMAVLSGPALLLGLATSGLAWHWDKQRRTVVIMYDLSENLLHGYEAFARAMESLGTAQRIWNVESAGRTGDWKRNAGAGTLINRTLAKIGYGVPSVVKTNVSIPAIIGGRQSIYFFPDVAIVNEGSKFGAIAHSDIELLWSTSCFLETGTVPSDAQVIGYSWQYVNRDGGPDRRFNNNRQIPQVNYQEMGIRSSRDLRKILQISKNCDRSHIDTAYRHLAEQVKGLAVSAYPVEPSQPATSSGDLQSSTSDADIVLADERDWVKPLVAAVGIITILTGAWFLGTRTADDGEPSAPTVTQETGLQNVVSARPAPSFDCGVVKSAVLKLVCSTPALAMADQQLALAYGQARTALANSPPALEALKLEQRAWIKTRNNSTATIAVIQQQYSERIVQLNAIAGGKQPYS